MSTHSTPALAEPAGRHLTEFDMAAADPIELLRSWLEQARAREVREPGAMVLGTADRAGRSSGRIVQVIGITACGLVFTSHDDSQKGREMAETRWASGVMYWRETRQQVTLAGPVERLPDGASDELWNARPAGTHPMSVASRQSAPLADEEALRAKASSLAQSAERLPRPAAWAGYELTPVTVEFWLESPDRLHRRLRYDLVGGRWTARRLQP